jgi:hypothetical protein
MVLNSLATPPARLDLARDQLAQVLQVHMAGHELGEGVGDGDDRLLEVPSFMPVARHSARAPAMLRPCGGGLGAVDGHVDVLVATVM